MPLLARIKHTLRAQNRGKFKAPWMLANVGYDVVYTIIMVKVFGRYGANGWAYAAFIAAFSLLWAWSTFELVGALVDGARGRAYRYATLATIAFIAPDIYLIIDTHNVPWEIWAVLGIYLAGSAVAAVVGLRNKVKGERTHEPDDAGDTGDATVAEGVDQA